MAEAYDSCARITAEYAKTFYLGTRLMTPEKARAIWCASQLVLTSLYSVQAFPFHQLGNPHSARNRAALGHILSALEILDCTAPSVVALRHHHLPCRAIYVWCRRTDELVDGPNASRITPAVRPSTSHFKAFKSNIIRTAGVSILSSVGRNMTLSPTRTFA